MAWYSLLEIGKNYSVLVCKLLRMDCISTFENCVFSHGSLVQLVGKRRVPDRLMVMNLSRRCPLLRSEDWHFSVDEFPLYK